METLDKIKKLIDEMSVDTEKVLKGNKSASIRVRKSAQDIKNLCGLFRKEVLLEVKKHKGNVTEG